MSGSLLFRIWVYEAGVGQTHNELNEVGTDPLVVETISESQLGFIFSQLEIDNIIPAKYPLSTFKNMASFFTFLIHHFMNVYSENEIYHVEITPEICPLVQFETEFAGRKCQMMLIHTEGNMFRILLKLGCLDKLSKSAK